MKLERSPAEIPTRSKSTSNYGILALLCMHCISCVVMSFGASATSAFSMSHSACGSEDTSPSRPHLVWAVEESGLALARRCRRSLI